MESHANSTPVQVYATCMCLPKNKAKENGHCQKKYCQGFGRLFGKGGLFGRHLLNKPSGSTVSTLCIYPRTPEQPKNVPIKKRLSLTTHAQDFILQLGRNILRTIINYNPDHVLLWKTCTGKKFINVYTLDLGWYVIKRHLLEQLLKPTHAEKQSPELWQVCWQVKSSLL